MGASAVDRHVIVCDVGAIGTPDLGTVEALARLQLVLGAAGVRVELRNAGPRLQELIELAGLQSVLRCAPTADGGSRPGSRLSGGAHDPARGASPGED